MSKWRRSTLFLSVWLPLFAAAMLIAYVRPWLAQGLGGERVLRASAGVRGGTNQWWVFDETTRAAHPLRTALLSLSDVQIGAIALGVVAVLLLWRWYRHRRV